MTLSRLPLLVSVFLGFCLFSTPGSATSSISKNLIDKIHNLEKISGGRIGLYARNIHNGHTIAYRETEQFPMGCTSKVIGVAAILKKSENHPHFLQEIIHYDEKALVPWSPITKKHVNSGMSIQALSEAAIRYSDNTAMNLLAIRLGGSKMINQYARNIGNKSFRQDHLWPEEASSGGTNNLNDSASPCDMASSLEKLTLGNELLAHGRMLLVDWLKHNTTGNSRIRAGTPKGWQVGDKTGTGDYGTTNDIGIIWPPGCSPIVAAIYYTHPNKSASQKNELIQETTRLIIDEFAQTDPCISLTRS